MPESADFLVIGSGVAGLRAAAALAAHGTVLVLTKAGDAGESNTGYAQGGVAAAVGDDDSPALHARDTEAAGDGLCDAEAVRVLVTDGPAYVRELASWGAAFDRDADGRFALGREGAHTVRRVLHAADATGREISRVLWQHVSALGRVRVAADARAVGLLLESGVCVGARYVVGTDVVEARAAATLLATGGAGRVFRETTNPPVATGDGVALAWQAGALVADMEFVQFHPTVMSVPGTPRFLLSEALRGDGAWLLNVHGERFMARYEPAGELASRDLVARAMVKEAARTGAPVTLSMRHLEAEWVRRRFPTLAAACRERGLDLAFDAIPVSPAAHYVMGGVATDIDGRTSLPGLYAAGEVACTGVHGANRLASNSLLEGLVFGARAADAMLGAPAAGVIRRPRRRGPMPRGEAGAAIPDADAVRALMWRDVGLVREAAGLTAAVATLDGWRRALVAAGRDAGDPTGALVTVAWLMARGALDRTESRGGHARADFPARDDLHWMVHVAESTHDQDS
ncbi:MAG: L-aspartate oxidase [Acidobacteria bacterium]|nr:L-aspartate oxidase [Acidobacteriota bacterium]